VEDRYRVGEIVEGVVTNVVRFGAFVGLEQGLEGLIHVSEFGEGNFMHGRNLVQEGEHVRARVVHIDGSERRLGLSLRLNAQDEPGAPEAPHATSEREAVASH
jgi:small subunit ribosomal protein S1